MTTNTSGAPEDRFCDLVMKGGITSGIVYPPAICELATEYRFKSIGGTSAGAIAAVMTAAAEFRRRETGTLSGFEVLKELPTVLGTKDRNGQTQLLRLFQPDASCRRLFSVLLASLNRDGTWRRIASIVLGFLRAYWFATLVSIAASALLYYFHSRLAGVLALVITLPLFVGFWVYRDFTRRVVQNGYGLCKGLTTQKENGEALTPWLHGLIQRAAGLGAGAGPLTFGQLWHAKGFPAGSLHLSEQEQKRVRSIDLQMFTTNLAHGRPYVFPHTEPTARLFYNRDELAPYLPADVMKWLNAQARSYLPNSEFPESDPPVSEAERLNLVELPLPENCPVLLATRMSLSFPLLFAAVPLWAIDYELPRKRRTFHRCYFSDGGISSNFPMHLFDGLMPLWPTFGIQLEAKLPDRTNMVFLPQSYREGIADRWSRFDEEPRSASRMGGFLASIVSTMQNWNDNMLSRMPGVRDRVVRLRLNEDEGGFNLNMPAKRITTISDRGREAAVEIIKRFIGPATATKPGYAEDPSAAAAPAVAAGWDDQRWVRLDVFVRAFGQRIAGLTRALGSSVPHATSYAELLKRSQTSPPPGHAEKLTPAQADALTDLIDALRKVSSEFDVHSPDYPNSPLPEPELRVRPPL